MKTLIILLLLSLPLIADDPFRTAPPELRQDAPAAAAPAPQIVYVQAPNNPAEKFSTAAQTWIGALTVVALALSGAVAKVMANVKDTKERLDRQSQKLENQGNQIVDVAKSQVPPAAAPAVSRSARVRKRKT